MTERRLGSASVDPSNDVTMRADVRPAVSLTQFAPSHRALYVTYVKMVLDESYDIYVRTAYPVNCTDDTSVKSEYVAPSNPVTVSRDVSASVVDSRGLVRWRWVA